MTGTEPAAARIDTSKPHPARVYDWFLGGKDNYPVDEELGRHIMSIDSRAKHVARTNRWFMQRVTRWMSGEAGIRQYLDIGTGIPTEPNLHQIAQAAAPESRVVYTDNDPIVLTHAEALLRSTPQGVTDYIQADVRDPGRILEQARKILDFERPIALSLVALLHFVSDDDSPYELVRRLVDALPSGSYLVLSQLTADFDPPAVQRGVDMYAAGGVTLVPRSYAEIGRFFEGLEPTEPGIVQLTQWHPELGVDEVTEGNEAASLYAGVARKP
ncbi:MULTISPECIES: SAM-dependent methyltransferase [unclassified Streptomyces]|uniref:SAM-dependent methyltransferase n=1 Tax=unclassified Streptomyces TaxID=2593676 RepID=UPI002DDBF5F4|nr:SAM-dependent methyltransferase [Streptomyces sp. NBC_01750]WSA99006.1 SAM-dependent methyltransferase [Streptomyces sp. NBC_01794]WSD36423.1 SAM-dependent methyltransferase [Streptomyces sp. NBC_01750]